MAKIRAYGDVQGNIVVEGDLDLEYDAQAETTYLHVSDGTVIECDWGEGDLNSGRGSDISLSVLEKGEDSDIAEFHYDFEDGTRTDVLSIKSPALEWVEFHRWMALPSTNELVGYWLDHFDPLDHRPAQLWEAYRALHRFDGEGEAALPAEPDGEGPRWPVSCDPNDRSTSEYWESQPRDPEIAAVLDWQDEMRAREAAYWHALAA